MRTLSSALQDQLFEMYGRRVTFDPTERRFYQRRS